MNAGEVGELINRVRDAVYWTPGLTLTVLAEAALNKKLKRLEPERGDPFPPRREPLKAGRPIQ